MKKILIIGGEGYIGNVVAQNLLDEGYAIVSYDNLLFCTQSVMREKVALDNCHILHRIHLRPTIIKFY